MATTGSNFVEVSATVLEGTAVTTAPSVIASNPGPAEAIEQGSGGVILDKVHVDLGLVSTPKAGSGFPLRNGGAVLGNYAKNGAAAYSTTGTTPVSPDLTDLTSGAASYAGDTTFAKAYVLVVKNLSATAAMTLAPGASNPAGLPAFTGTTPTISLPAGSTQVFHSSAGVTVDSTHKVLTITPTAGGNFSIAVGGA